MREAYASPRPSVKARFDADIPLAKRGRSRVLKYSCWCRLPKKVQMQGGRPTAGVPPAELGPGVLGVRRSEFRGRPTLQIGLFSGLRPARTARPGPYRPSAAGRPGPPPCSSEDRAPLAPLQAPRGSQPISEAVSRKVGPGGVSRGAVAPHRPKRSAPERRISRTSSPGLARRTNSAIPPSAFWWTIQVARVRVASPPLPVRQMA